jgi:hypothetical protein
MQPELCGSLAPFANKLPISLPLSLPCRVLISLRAKRSVDNCPTLHDQRLNSDLFCEMHDPYHGFLERALAVSLFRGT